MYRLAIISFLRSRSVMAALFLFLVAGVVSIYIGKQFLDKQENAAAAVTQQQREHIERTVGYMKDNYGLALYYLRFAYIHKPAPIAALAIGQQDVNATIQYLTIRGLEGQRYDTDLYNPYNLLTGNFDLSFVILFLFPLLIIGFCFNLLSQEMESGTWPMVRVQARSVLWFIWQKISVRLAVVMTLLLSLIGLAALIIGIPLDEILLAYTVTAVLYLFVWFGICFLFAAFRTSSNINALLQLTTWVFFCLLFPALINNYLTVKYPVPEAYSNLIKQRDSYHSRWDMDQQTTLKDFFAHYPQYSRFEWKKPGFNYLWYYAMQQMGDDGAQQETRAMYRKMHARQQLSARISNIFPAMQAQLQFSRISGTDLHQHLRFLDSTAAFHERLRHYFYPKIFGESNMGDEDWALHRPEYFNVDTKPDWTMLLLPPVIIICFLTASAVYLFKMRNE